MLISTKGIKSGKSLRERFVAPVYASETFALEP